MGRILDKLEQRRIVRIAIDKELNVIDFNEQCDDWFGCYLTKEEMIELVSELNELIDQMK